MFTDIHSHILYDIDDGPKTIEETINLLEYTVKCGCNKLVITPHFYAAQHSLEEQINLAELKFSEIKKYILDNNIELEVLLGYEVRYFDGISSCESLDKLCINNSNYILLELDYGDITDRIINELIELGYNGFNVIIAHIERYYKFKGYKKLLNLVQNGFVLTQVTAASFLGGSYKKTAEKLIKENLVDFIASDMHSLENRPPLIDKALCAIEKKYGTEKKQELIKSAKEFFEKIY